jgi:glycosyltransferase involved in cell wall biosynthesis
MVSIVISFYQRLEHLRRCLDSLKYCAQDFDEVVITDDGSDKDIVSSLKNMISYYPFPISHVWQPKMGFRVAAARNNGIRHAKGEYLIFLDCDFLVLSDTIKYHIKNACPKRFVASAYKYLSEDQTDQVFRSGISLDLLEHLYCQIPDREIITAHRRSIKRNILMQLRLVSYKKQSLGGHFSIYRKDIESINGYDENFVGWGGEDEDLGKRLVKAGIFSKLAFRYARVLHMWHPKALGCRDWQDGPNMDYFNRTDIPFFCKNGLKK